MSSRQFRIVQSMGKFIIRRFILRLGGYWAHVRARMYLFVRSCGYLLALESWIGEQNSHSRYLKIGAGVSSNCQDSSSRLQLFRSRIRPACPSVHSLPFLHSDKSDTLSVKAPLLYQVPNSSCTLCHKSSLSLSILVSLCKLQLYNIH